MKHILIMVLSLTCHMASFLTEHLGGSEHGSGTGRRLTQSVSS